LIQNEQKGKNKSGVIREEKIIRRAGRPLTGPLKIRKLIFREPFCPPPTSAREPIFKFGFIGEIKVNVIKPSPMIRGKVALCTCVEFRVKLISGAEVLIIAIERGATEEG